MIKIAFCVVFIIVLLIIIKIGISDLLSLIKNELKKEK